jgi:hypothetical protein
LEVGPFALQSNTLIPISAAYGAERKT